MRKFKSSAEAGNTTTPEVNLMISMTVPDQSLSIREILKRYASGTISDIAHKNVIYSEDMPDLRGLDISELYEMRHEAQQDIDLIQNELKFRKEKNDLPPTQTEIDFEENNPTTEVK